jgi:hypothetical protein
MNAIPYIPGFFATPDGRIFEVKNGQQVEAKESLNKDGYLEIFFIQNGKRKRTHKHRAICAAFNGAPPSKESLARHLDDNKLNNSIKNLKWGSAMDNQVDARNNWNKRSNTGHWNSKFSENDILDIRMLLSFGAKGVEIARAYNVTKQAIYRIKNGWVWNAFSAQGNNKQN